MLIADAVSMAKDELCKAGLLNNGWIVVLDNAKMRAGICYYGRKQIGLSRFCILNSSYDEVFDTVTHEVAHALCPGHYHDHVWKAKHRSLGGSGKTCGDAEPSLEAAAKAAAPWTGHCPCGRQFFQQRAPRRVTYCQVCRRGWTEANRISWLKYGHEMPLSSMPKTYQVDMKALILKAAKEAELLPA